jgi:hypothetical protein
MRGSLFERKNRSENAYAINYIDKSGDNEHLAMQCAGIKRKAEF